MFSSIRIQGFRSCADVQLDAISNILLLIGRNGAGKTNILKAVEWACYFASHPAPKRELAFRPAHQGTVELIFNIGNQSYRYYLDVSVRLAADGAFKRRIKEEISTVSSSGTHKRLIERNGEDVRLFSHAGKPSSKNVQISDSIPCLIALQSLLAKEDHFRVTAEKLIEFLSAVRYYSLENHESGVSDLYITGSDYKKWLNETPVESNLTRILLFKLIHLSNEKQDKFNELLDLLGENGLNLIDDILISSRRVDDSDDSTEFHMVFFIPSGLKNSENSHALGYNSLSFGTKRILLLLVSMLYDEASVSLLEQPEDGIHNGLVAKLIPMLRRYSTQCQFLITTHSTIVLNRIEPEEVRLICMENGKTIGRALDEKELEAARAFLDEDGPLADFLESIAED